MVIHHQGTQHCNADALSRIPCRQCGRFDQGKEVEFSASVRVLPAFPFQPYSLEEMQGLQMEDASINQVYQSVRHGQIPPLDVSKTWSRESRLLLQKWQLLCIKNSVLWKRIGDGDDGLQLVLPSKLQASAIRDLLEGAVEGLLEEKVLSHLKERFCWPGCAEAARDWCKSCLTCATRKMTVPKRKAYLQSIQSGYPMQLVSIDILGPLPVTEEGNKYVLAAVDHFTSWVEAFSNQESRSYNSC